jgi:hypothetical protein
MKERRQSFTKLSKKLLIYVNKIDDYSESFILFIQI